MLFGRGQRIPSALVDEWNEKSRCALIVEGGGMRGAISLGALLGLSLSHLRWPDTIYASSAGAFNACYYLAGGISIGARLYVESLSSPEFISLARFWRVLDLDYAIRCIRERHPIDWHRVRAAPARLQVAVMDSQSGDISFLDPAHSASPLEVLRASAALPGLYGRQVAVEGHYYVDGGAAALPVDTVAADGNSLCLALLTRRADDRRSEPSAVAQALSRVWLHGLSSAARTRCLRRSMVDNDARDRLMAERDRTGLKAIVIAPSAHDHIPSRLTRDRARIAQAIREGAERMLHAVYGDPADWPTRARAGLAEFEQAALHPS